MARATYVDRFFQGLEAGGKMSDREAERADRQREIDAEETAEKRRRKLNDMVARGISGGGQTPAPAAPTQAVPAPPAPSQAVQAPPGPETALPVPAGAVQPPAAMPSPTPSAVAPQGGPQAPSAPGPEMPKNHFYDQLLKDRRELLEEGVPIEQVMAATEIITKHHAGIALKTANIGLGYMQQAEKEPDQEKKMTLLAGASKQFEEAYAHIPDGRSVEIELTPQGMLLIKQLDANGEVMGPGVMANAEIMAGVIDRALNPESAPNVVEAAMTKAEKAREENRKDRKVAAAETTASAAQTRAGASVTSANASALSAKSQADARAADQRRAAGAEPGKRAKTDAEAARLQAEADKLRGDSSGSNAETMALDRSIGRKATEAERTALKKQLVTALANGQSPFTHRDKSGVYFLPGGQKAAPGLVSIVKRLADQEGVPLVPEGTDSFGEGLSPNAQLKRAIGQ